MPRNPLIDVLKGFAIILVVIGHASQWFTADDRTNPLYVTIYAFHMPLFMFLSGYVNFNTKGQISLSKRFQVLVIPFFIWFLISAAYHGYILNSEKVYHYLSQLIYEPTKGMWFLWLLFWQCVILYIALKIKKNNELWAMIGLWSILVFTHRITGAQAIFYGLPELCWYLIYFSLGYAFHKYEEKAITTLRPFAWASLIVFPLLLLFPVEKTNFILYTIRLYTLALTGIAASYVLWEKFCHYQTKTKQLLKYLGGISLEIYVTHYYCIFLVPYIKTILGDNLYLNALVFTLLAIALCDVIQRLVQQVKWLRRLLYGRF
ncbi:acyltransferase family protein [Capnocytophaga sp. oral taxon 878]|uniref:acyltransferase family protein n=1 Tax=Capnocytophaga sp. oral taxon 878 TaxID=1316596 RepID=UPI000D047C44|nr:acyltransferase family protein [Capnocytophaga sp. oral taxon 878]AVM49632.1 acyltransferase [Capnocytophaga sp. oral taxon 878]